MSILMFLVRSHRRFSARAVAAGRQSMYLFATARSESRLVHRHRCPHRRALASTPRSASLAASSARSSFSSSGWVAVWLDAIVRLTSMRIAEGVRRLLVLTRGGAGHLVGGREWCRRRGVAVEPASSRLVLVNGIRRRRIAALSVRKTRIDEPWARAAAPLARSPRCEASPAFPRDGADRRHRRQR
jgi:hypothetical protein